MECKRGQTIQEQKLQESRKSKKEKKKIGFTKQATNPLKF